jgi:hypothetical protein
MCICCRIYYTYNVLSSFSAWASQEFSADKNTPLTNIHSHTQNGIGDNIGPEISIVLSSEILAFPEVIMWKFRFCRIAFRMFDWSTLGGHWNPDSDNNKALNTQIFLRQKYVIPRFHYAETSSSNYLRGAKK